MNVLCYCKANNFRHSISIIKKNESVTLYKFQFPYGGSNYVLNQKKDKMRRS